MTDLLKGSLLLDKVAIVTGAGHPKGIGRAIANAFQREGAIVVITDLAGARGLEEAGGIALDVTDPVQVDAAVKRIIDEHMKLDIVVNNAGVGVGSPDFLQLSDQDWELSLNVNVRGVANV